jgi:DNA mismatch endonuclease (patch repair protein)
MDNLTPEQRKKNMQNIKSKNTKIEIKLRKALWTLGYRYRIHQANLPGKPDIVFSSKKIAIFCDSTFWHGYDWEHRESRIKSNRGYWIKKIESNMERDRITNEKLNELGWHVIRFWDFEIDKELNRCVNEVIKLLE